ncbi:MAG: chemotaxis protein CheW [Desulfovibrionaceae bacterium]
MSDRSKPKRMASGKKKLFCTFWLAGRLYGVDILDVKEVNPEISFTTVHHAPSEVSGFVNIRGQIHLILDLRRILGFTEGDRGERSRLVLFKPTVAESFGILVDRISDVVEVDEDRIESGHLAEDAGGDPKGDSSGIISGVCRLEDSLLLIINARDLLKTLDKTPTTRIQQ